MATRRTADANSLLIGPAYAVAILFVVLPIIDTFSQTWPITLSSPGWRYGTIGIGANYLISILFGTLGIIALAADGEHRRTLRVMSVLCGIATVIALVAMIGFLLDAIQVRAGIPAGETRTRRLFDIGGAKAALKYVLAALVFGWLTFAAWRRAKAIPRVKGDEAAVLVGEHRK